MASSLLAPGGGIARGGRGASREHPASCAEHVLPAGTRERPVLRRRPCFPEHVSDQVTSAPPLTGFYRSQRGGRGSTVGWERAKDRLPPSLRSWGRRRGRGGAVAAVVAAGALTPVRVHGVSLQSGAPSVLQASPSHGRLLLPPHPPPWPHPRVPVPAPPSDQTAEKLGAERRLLPPPRGRAGPPGAPGAVADVGIGGRRVNRTGQRAPPRCGS